MYCTVRNRLSARLAAEGATLIAGDTIVRKESIAVLEQSRGETGVEVREEVKKCGTSWRNAGGTSLGLLAEAHLVLLLALAH